ncbi:hypothetical protein [Curtobacterium ammoniigenes]|uniref:hypothetical protein n=1 Tax=Curtobacterium ammoniigenes TaxID=395387 RepID=UPI000836DCBF|nr:hypothetical protein [Curtobacterium ammoniigenes]
MAGALDGAELAPPELDDPDPLVLLVLEPSDPVPPFDEPAPPLDDPDALPELPFDERESVR